MRKKAMELTFNNTWLVASVEKYLDAVKTVTTS